MQHANACKASPVFLTDNELDSGDDDQCAESGSALPLHPMQGKPPWLSHITSKEQHMIMPQSQGEFRV